MTFSDAIRYNIVECLNFRDRAPRSAYWWYVLFVSLGSLVTFLLDFIIFWPKGDGAMLRHLADNFGSISDFYINVMPITTFWYLLNYLPILACGVRRMRDQDRPAWWYVAIIVVVTGMSFVIFSITGPQTAEMMSIVFDPTSSFEEINRVLVEFEEFNRTQSILSGLQTIPSIILIIWMASKGTVGPNQHGEDPLA